MAGRQVSAVLSDVTIAESDAWILNPDGTALGTSAVVTPTLGGFLDGRTTPTDGTYTLLLNPREGYTGNATVTLYDATDATMSIPADGTPVQAATAIPGQNIRLTFGAAAGDRVLLRIAGSTYSAGFQCGLTVAILDPAGATLASNSCILGFSDTVIDTVSLPSAGTHTVFLNPMSANTGTVTLTLYAVPADLTGTITPEVPISDSLAVGQTARYAFSGTAGSRVSVNVPAGSISCQGQGLLDRRRAEVCEREALFPGSRVSREVLSDTRNLWATDGLPKRKTDESAVQSRPSPKHDFTAKAREVRCRTSRQEHTDGITSRRFRRFDAVRVPPTPGVSHASMDVCYRPCSVWRSSQGRLAAWRAWRSPIDSGQRETSQIFLILAPRETNGEGSHRPSLSGQLRRAGLLRQRRFADVTPKD